jgi:hypothetical protein
MYVYIIQLVSNRRSRRGGEGLKEEGGGGGSFILKKKIHLMMSFSKNLRRFVYRN